MTWLTEHWLAVALLLGYTTLLLHNAWIGARSAHDRAGYVVGGRTMGGTAIGISFYATFASTNSYIGHAGKGYDWGAPWLLMAAMLVLFTWLSWRFVAPRLRAFTADAGALTLPDYLGARFARPDHPRHPLRLASAVVVVFASLLYLIAIFKGAGHLFDHFLGIGYAPAVLLTLVIVVLYTSVGGFVSVVRTDVIQGLLMLFGAVLMFVFVTRAAGGVGSILELAARPDTRHLFTLDAGVPFIVLLGVALSGSLKLLVDPRQLSRFFALRDAAEVRRGLWVAVLGLLLVQACLYPIGLYAHLLLDEVGDTDQIVPILLGDPTVFPVSVADVLIVAIVAAAMSSIDSVLLVAGSTLEIHLVAPFRRPLEPDTGRALLAMRLAVVGLAVVAALLALRPPGGIVEITIFSGSLYAVCFLPAVLLGLYWSRGSATAVLTSMAVGITVLVGWLLLGLGGGLHEVFPGLVAATGCYLLVCMGERPRAARVDAAHEPDAMPLARERH